MMDMVRIGDTIYVPVKIDRITTTKKCGEAPITGYGGMLECTQPGNGERQKILVCFDTDYVLDKCRIDSAIVYACGYGKDKEEEND